MQIECESCRPSQENPFYLARFSEKSFHFVVRCSWGQSNQLRSRVLSTGIVQRGRHLFDLHWDRESQMIIFGGT